MQWQSMCASERGVRFCDECRCHGSMDLETSQDAVLQRLAATMTGVPGLSTAVEVPARSLVTPPRPTGALPRTPVQGAANMSQRSG